MRITISTIIMISAGMLAFGLLQMRNAPVDVFPEFAPPKVDARPRTRRWCRQP